MCIHSFYFIKIKIRRRLKCTHDNSMQNNEILKILSRFCMYWIQAFQFCMINCSKLIALSGRYGQTTQQKNGCMADEIFVKHKYA